MHKIVFGGCPPHSSQRCSHITSVWFSSCFGFHPINTVCLPTNFLFELQAEQNNASHREKYFRELEPVMHYAFGGKPEKKTDTILCNRTKNAVGKPKRQDSTQVLNEFVCSLTHFLKKCGMLLESQRSDHCWLAAFEEQYGFLPHMMPSVIFSADVCTVCIYVEFMSHWFDA